MNNNNNQKKQTTSYFILTKDDILYNVVQDSVRAAELLTEYGLHCVSCYFSEWDTVETGARIHGMTDEEINTMIDEINEQMKKEWEEDKNPSLI